MCQPLGIEPLIRRMNKSPHLLKRRAVVSALIKWRVSAEEEQLKLSGRRRAGSDGSSHSLQLGLVGAAHNGPRGCFQEAMLRDTMFLGLRGWCLPGSRAQQCQGTGGPGSELGLLLEDGRSERSEGHAGQARPEQAYSTNSAAPLLPDFLTGPFLLNLVSGICHIYA